MKINLFATKHAELMKRSLDVYAKQVRANARNIANINNPNYKPVKTDFSEALETAQQNSNLRRTRKRHIAGSADREQESDSSRGKGQPVDLVKEMSELAENQIRFEFVSDRLRRYYDGLKTSIKNTI